MSQAFKLNTVNMVVAVLFYLLKPGIDWVMFPFYVVASMGIGCGTAVVMQLLPWPSSGSKQLLDALGAVSHGCPHKSYSLAHRSILTRTKDSALMPPQWECNVRSVTLRQVSSRMWNASI